MAHALTVITVIIAIIIIIIIISISCYDYRKSWSLSPEGSSAALHAKLQSQSSRVELGLQLNTQFTI